MSVMNLGYVMLLNYDWVVYPSLALLTDEKALTKGLNNDWGRTWTKESIVYNVKAWRPQLSPVISTVLFPLRQYKALLAPVPALLKAISITSMVTQSHHHISPSSYAR